MTPDMLANIISTMPHPMWQIQLPNPNGDKDVYILISGDERVFVEDAGFVQNTQVKRN